MKDARPGLAAETFTEHEVDTAQRGYPAEIVEGTKRTARMPRVELDQILKTKSGTRPVASSEDIEGHLRDRLSSIATPFVELIPQSLEPAPSSTVAESLAMSAPRAPSVAAPSLVPARRSSGLLVATFVFVALFSGVVGFVLGRLHH